MKKNYLCFRLLFAAMILALNSYSQCTPTVSYTALNMSMTNVTLGATINNNSGNNGYTDYTAQTVSINQGTTSVAISVTLSNTYNRQIAVFVDWNSGSTAFANRIFNVYGFAGQTITGNLTIPAGVSAGSYRLRVASDYDGSAPVSACYSDYGEFEDYTLQVLPSPMTLNSISVKHNFELGTSFYNFNQSINSPVLKVFLNTSGTLSPLTLNSLHFNNVGTTNTADISNYKLFYNTTDSSFSGATMIAQSTSLSTLTFTPFALNTTNSSANYFWLAIDGNPASISGNILDFQLDSVRINSSNVIPSITSPAGNYVVSNELYPYGNNSWIAHSFNGFNFDTYRGYYTSPGLNFDSQVYWNNSPSEASTYNGYNVNVDNHSVIYKRKGFNDSIYRINIVKHDDDAFLDVNGVEKWNHINGCCDSHNEIWSGVLRDTSRIDFKWKEGGGGSNGGVSFEVVHPTITSFNPANALYNTQITITGQYFYAIDSVYVGGVKALSFNVADSVTITAMVGCGTDGNVQIFSHYGNDSENGFTMNYTTFYADADGDTYGDVNTILVQCTQPTGYVLDATDCNDADDAINPATIWYADADGDGYGATDTVRTQCMQPTGFVLNATDCDDADEDVNPDLVWYADADGDDYGDVNTTLVQCAQPTGYVLDATDCDDTDDAINPVTTWYADADGDDYGDVSTTLVQCTQPAGYVLDATDCDDTDDVINPATIWYADADGDDYGDVNTTLVQCTQPTGYVLDATDCDDTDDVINPATTWYADADGDDYGDVSTTLVQCTQPAGYVLDATDCDDTDDVINPATIWYADADGDDYGDVNTTLVQCTQPTGYVLDATDCDDTDEDVNPDLVWYADTDNDLLGDVNVTITQCNQPTGYILDNNDCNDNDNTIGSSVSATFDLGLATICDDGGVITLNGGLPAGGTYSGTGVTGSTFDPNGLSGAIVLSYTYISGYCSATATYSVDVELCSGIASVSGVNYTIYPNPSENGVIYLKGISASTKISLYTVLGTEINATVSISNNIATIDMTGNAAGSYLVKIIDAEKSVTKKVSIGK